MDEGATGAWSDYPNATVTKTTGLTATHTVSPTPTISPPASRPCKQQCCQTNDPESLGLIVPKGSKTKLRTPPARLNFVGAPKCFPDPAVLHQSWPYRSLSPFILSFWLLVTPLVRGSSLRAKNCTQSRRSLPQPPRRTGRHFLPGCRQPPSPRFVSALAIRRAIPTSSRRSAVSVSPRTP